MKSLLPIILTVTAYVCAAVTDFEQYVVHESRISEASRWVKGDKIPSDVLLPMRIGLKPNKNAERNADDWLMDVSDPDSVNYGKHWTLERVTETFQPSDRTVQTVTRWLVSTGLIERSRILQSTNKAWLAFDIPTGAAEKLLKTEYHEYSHMLTGRVEIACNEYFIPQSLKEHIDYVTPGLKGLRIAPEVRVSRREPGNVTYHHHDPYKRRPPNNTLSLSVCDYISTPACIRALYQFEIASPNATVSPNNSMGIYESGEYLKRKDLDLYFTTFAPHVPNGTHPYLDRIDATNATTHFSGEPDLDFSIAYSIIYPQSTTLYQTNDRWYSTKSRYLGIFNTFLDAIDGSYCTYSAYGETGDDPKIDPTYPDTHSNKSGGYKGQLMCGVFKPTNVISISYGYDEAALPDFYEKRQCNEFLKLALQGVSVFVASDDGGVDCVHYKPSPFGASVPGNCPYVTSVGATKIARGNSVYDSEVAAYAREEFDGYVFSSSGGFSNVFSAPEYQKKTLAKYFADHDPPYPYYENGNYNHSKGIYNRNGRGYPDVSANGQHCPLFQFGEYFLTWGTSASAPIFASLINRIIEERIRHGKGPIGLVNPVLYKHPEVLNDITEGNNTACTAKEGTLGFTANAGWDPVTGLGTPNYPKMLKLFLSLP